MPNGSAQTTPIAVRPNRGQPQQNPRDRRFERLPPLGVRLRSRTFEPCHFQGPSATLGPMSLLLYRDLATIAMLLVAIIGVMLVLRATRTSRA